jgi:para-aminobenzoate synthetase
MAPAILTQRRRILFLDAYDSFSNNIVALIEQNVDAEVVKVYIDEPFLGDEKGNGANSVAFSDYVRDFDAVVAPAGQSVTKTSVS